MIRWSYVVPRLLIVAALWAFLAFGLDPMIRWSLVRSGESLLGAKVEIDAVRTSLRGTRLEIRGVQAADPDAPMKNLAEAERLLIDLDAKSLLLRRLVVDRAEVSGLQLKGDRATSGQLAKQDTEPKDAANGLPALDPQWLARLTDDLVENLTSDFESVKIVETATERWSGKYKAWEQQVRKLRDRARALKEKYKNIDRRDPRQIAQLVQELPREVQAIQAEFDALQREILTVQDAAAQEFANLAAARDRDMERWRDKIKFDEFNALRLTEFLLGPELDKRVGQAMEWVAHGRDLSDTINAPPKRNISDEVILFGRLPVHPNVLIREAVVDGVLDVNGKSTPFAAVAKDIAVPASNYAKPTTVQLISMGDIRFQIDGTLDYRYEIPSQQFKVHCPKLVVPAQTLGSRDKVAIQSQRGNAEVHCNVLIRDGQIEGQVEFTQRDAQLQPMLSRRYGPRVTESLRESLAQIRELKATIYLSGDARRPKTRIQSELGDVVSRAIRGALQKEVDYQQQRVATRLNDELTKRLDRFDQLLASKKQDLLDELHLDSKQVEQLLNLAPQMNLGRLNLPQNFNLNGLLRR